MPVIDIRAAAVRLTLLTALACSPAVDDPGDGAPVAEPREPLRPAALRGTVPEAARIADYALEARLDAETHRVTGNARVRWRNATGRATETLRFHLYMNGFRAEDTAWMRSSRGRHRRVRQREEGAWGFIDVHAVTLADAAGPRLAGGIEQPPAGAVALEFAEDEDPSTMTVRLPEPVAPGETVTVALAFTTQLPRVVARTGFAGDFHAVAQWYPKIGVLEEDGWDVHTFTHHDEFYADFGHYDVTLDVPASMVVGATGVRTGEELADDRKRLTYRAEMVHDFAWMAAPDFVEHHGEWRGVRIRQLLAPEHAGDAGSHLSALLSAFDSYERRCGPYPWSTLTVVHVPRDARGAGGMEYPTLFTTGRRLPIPGWIRATVFDERISGWNTTIHEFGHQYFQGLLASREHLEPWLDEGLATFTDEHALLDWLGEDPWVARVLNHKLYAPDAVRLALGAFGFLDPIDRPARSFDALVGSYGAVYVKTAALLDTLRNLAGAEPFDRALRRYCEEQRFRHPRGEDFEAVLVDELGARIDLAPPGAPPAELDVGALLDQGLRTTRAVDFEILEVRNRRRPGTAGWRRTADGELAGGEPPAGLDRPLAELGDEAIEAAVAVHRAGAFVVPVELEVEFADGGRERRVWDGRDATAVFTFPGRRARRAVLDPDGKLALEVERLDNVAYASDARAADGLSDPFGALAEALALALAGSLGP